MPGTISQYQVVIAGQLITASLWNGMELNIINNGLIPAGIDDYSATDGEMQTATDPFPAGATSRPTSLQGEIERIRYQFANITGETYWYNDPDVTIAAMKTNFDAHTHDGTSNQGPQIGTAGIADVAVTTAKIALQAITNGRIQDGAVGTTQLADAGVTTAKIADLNVTTGKIAAAAVDENKLAASVAGSGITGGAGTPLAVGVDNSTVEISSDAVRIKDAGVTEAKLATAVVNKLGQNIGLVAIVETSSNGTLLSYSGQGRLRGICSPGGSSTGCALTIDGVAVDMPTTIASGEGLMWGTNSGGTPIVSDAAALLDSLDIHFKTSIVFSKTGGTGTLTIAYERAA